MLPSAIILNLSQFWRHCRINYPEDMHIKNELALCYQHTGNWKAGIDCYENMIGADPANIYFRMQKADMLYNLENYNNALNLYQNILGEKQNTTILKQIDRCFENLHKTDSTQLYYKKAWDMNPNGCIIQLSYACFALYHRDRRPSKTGCPQNR